MDVRKAFILVLVAFTLTFAVAYAVVISERRIQSYGTIKAVRIGVYRDSACTEAVRDLDWGLLSPGDSVNRTVYIRNTGNSAVTLSMATRDWNPTSASEYITVSWNREEAVLRQGEAVKADITLTVSPSIQGVSSFSFEIVISGSG